MLRLGGDYRNMETCPRRCKLLKKKEKEIFMYVVTSENTAILETQLPLGPNFWSDLSEVSDKPY